MDLISAVETFSWTMLEAQLINLRARWAVEKALQASAQSCHTGPPVFSPGLCLSLGPSFLPYMHPRLCCSFPVPRPAMPPSQSRELPKLLCSNIRTSV